MSTVEDWRIDRVLDEVFVERRAQDAKWGEQNHPDGTGPDGLYLGITHLERANEARAYTDLAAKNGHLTFKDIFLEEVFEALAEEDKDKLRTELIQVAAVAVAWVEKIDRGN